MKGKVETQWGPVPLFMNGRNVASGVPSQLKEVKFPSVRVVGWWCQHELDYEIVVINFFVDVMVWEKFLLVQLSDPLKTSFQGFGRTTTL